MGSRTKARECALQALYQLDTSGASSKTPSQVYVESIAAWHAFSSPTALPASASTVSAFHRVATTAKRSPFASSFSPVGAPWLIRGAFYFFGSDKRWPILSRFT